MAKIQINCFVQRSRFPFVTEVQFDSLISALTNQLQEMSIDFISTFADDRLKLSESKFQIDIGPTLRFRFPVSIPHEKIVYFNPLFKGWKSQRIGSSLIQWSNIGFSEPCTTAVERQPLFVECSMSAWLFEWMCKNLGFAVV